MRRGTDVPLQNQPHGYAVVPVHHRPAWRDSSYRDVRHSRSDHGVRRGTTTRRSTGRALRRGSPPGQRHVGCPARALDAASGRSRVAIRARQRPVPPRRDRTLLMPVKGAVVSRFGMRHDPVYQRPQLHAGIDIAAPSGAPIRAAGPGCARPCGGTEPGTGSAATWSSARRP